MEITEFLKTEKCFSMCPIFLLTTEERTEEKNSVNKNGRIFDGKNWEIWGELNRMKNAEVQKIKKLTKDFCMKRNLN